jgi:hypothetical protein
VPIVAAQREVVLPFVAEQSLAGERSFEEEQSQPAAVAITLGDIVIPTINIAVVAPTPPVSIVEARLFIVAVQSQEVALLLEAEARTSPTAVAVVVGRNPDKGTTWQAPVR